MADFRLTTRLARGCFALYRVFLLTHAGVSKF
jgi:hypothetical protein